MEDALGLSAARFGRLGLTTFNPAVLSVNAIAASYLSVLF